MKKILVLLFLFMAFLGHAQSGISYQAVLMSPTAGQLPGADNPKSPLVNATICLRFSISPSVGGTPEYQETITASTDGFGMVNVVIGAVNPSGFAAISWGTGTKYLKVELDHTGSCNGSNTFSGVSEQPFTTVPFALYALNSGSGGGSLNNGNVYIGNSSNVATAVPVTGDVTITNAGVTAIGTGKVTDGKLDKTNIPLSGFGAASADVNLGTNKLINVTNPSGPQDAATKSYVDSATGAITTLADGNVYIGNGLGVATAVSVTGDVTISNAGVTTIGTGKVDNTKLDKINIPLSGFGAASADVNLGTNKLINVTNPSGPQDAATKSYVDSATGAITTLADRNVYIGNGLGVATAVPVTGDVTISNTGATTIEPNAVTSAKISDDTITDDDINSAAAIQTTKIKGFYTGFWKKSINGSSYPITLSDLSIPPGSITDNSIIIFQTNTPGTDVLSSTPIKTPLNSPSYTEIKIEFSALVNTTIKLSYIIILNN